MSDERTGMVIVIGELQTFASGFQKREFVIKTDGEYPQELKFSAMKEKADKVADLAVGDVITVSFNIRGNEYNGKHYVDLMAYKWALQAAAGGTGEAVSEPEPDPEGVPLALNGEDNLPF